MKKYFLFALLHLLSSSVLGSIEDYIYPHNSIPTISNYGTTGLLQNPTARLHEEGTLAFSWSHNDPYLRGSLIAYPFDWFEASYQYTDVNNALYSDVPSFSGNQTYKDKSFDAKFRLKKEGPRIPQIAIGFRDLAGTGMFSSEYIVLSKRFNYVDLSFGLAWGAMGIQNYKNPLTNIDNKFSERTQLQDTQGGEFSVGAYFSGPMGAFAGAEIILPNTRGTRLVLEYDATDYNREGLRDITNPFVFDVPKEQKSKINIGFTHPVTQNFHLKLGFTKGNTLNFGFSYKRTLAKKKEMKKKTTTLVKSYSKNIKNVNSTDDELIYLSALKFLAENKLYLQTANVTDDTFSMAYTQATFFSGVLAHGRVARVLDDIAPDNIQKFEITLLNGALPINKLTIDRDAFSRNKDDNLYVVAKEGILVESADHDARNYEYLPRINFPIFDTKIAPTVRQQIGGPDAFYFGEARLQLQSRIILRNDMNLNTIMSVGLIDNFDALKLSSDSVLPHVRTDIVGYLKESRDFSISRMNFNWFGNIGEDVYTKMSIGLMETMFGGYGAEILYRPFTSSWALGAEIWDVKQRAFKMRLGFREYETVTGHVNLYYKEPRSKIIATLKMGRFLAEDSGYNLDVARRFESGLRLGVFFAKTDISETEFGEGSFDKGFYFQLPLDLFLGKHSKGIFGTGLRPLTRDGAAFLENDYSLFGVTEQGQALNITRDWDDLYQ
jgi:hypothetical protein